MRPLELRVKGFRSYRAEATFDFRGRRLIGVVGPIGAGKSSLLDAIAFALYGKTPAFERGTRSLIHQLEDVAHVELTFEVDGQIWRAQRGIRRAGASGHRLDRLATDAPGAEVLESVLLERAVRDRVERLLGLDFSAFCRSVLLAQNRFAEFLQAAPGMRNEVLKGVFGYERFDAALALARERLASATAVLETLEAEGARLTEARASLAAVTAEVEATTARSDAFETARPRIEELHERRATAQAAIATATASIASLEQASAGLPDPEALASALETAQGAASSLARAEVSVTGAEQTLAAAETEREAAAQRAAEVMPFAALLERKDTQARAVTAAIARVSTSQETLADAGRTLARASEAESEAERGTAAAAEAAATAAASVERATAALHAAQHLDRAAALRRELVAGEPCPVCAQVLHHLPATLEAPALERADGDVVAARSLRRSAEQDATAAIEALATCAAQHRAALDLVEAASAGLADATSDRDRAEAALAATDDEIVNRLGEGDPRALVQTRLEERDAADERVRVAGAAAAAARTDRDAIARGHARTLDTLASLGSRIAGAWGLLGEGHEPVAGLDELRAAFEELGRTVLQRTTEAREAVEAASTDRRAADAALTVALEDLGMDVGADFTDALAEARARREVAMERSRAITDELDAGADLDARTEAALADLALIRLLRDDLQPARFLAWLLEEERAALAEVGSVHFEQLTAGAYRFADDDSFRIIDVNGGGAERPSESLSGGETFLASLALALALAEMVARGGGRLDAFFLDEGFGSLDPEHLERAMEGIDRLVAADDRRLVVLVSHVEQMRQMLEDLIVLDKDESGHTLVLAGAGPAAPMG